ncbi:MAG: hypothetical protein DRN17_05645 [Thermoplasmata archaeon]|nr:MAG: hypothetical protein DRN17_05645 [Thermoplasmata archaeon]
MKAFITEVEIYDDDPGDPMLIAKLKAFDDEAFSITINDKIVSADDIEAIARLLREGSPLYKEIKESDIGNKKNK